MIRPPRIRKHNCREHIVRRVAPKSTKSAASGTKAEYCCGVCHKPVSFRMRANEVLMRVN